MYDAQCVILNDILFVGGGDTQSDYDAMLFMTPTDSIHWSTSTTPAMFYALATYHSELVLVGEIDISTRQITNKLWTSSAGMDWKVTLPAMPTKRHSSSAINTITPEYLIVAGGGGDNLVDSDTVEVLVDKKWWTVQPLPQKMSDMKPTVHAGKLYLLGGVSQRSNVYYCDISALTECCQQPNMESESSLWKCFKVNSCRSCSASFGKHLISIGGGDNRTYASGIIAFSPLTEAWVHVGEVPVALRDAACIVMPSAQSIMVIGGRTTTGQNARVYKASLTGKA